MPVPSSATLEAAGQVDVNDVETARAQLQVERGDVDDDLVALAHLTEQHLIRPGPSLLAVDLDRQRVFADDDAAAQLQAAAHRADISSPAAATIPSHTSSIASRLRVETLSSAVWLASVPLASRTQSKPAAISALASLPPPVEVR